MKTRQSTRLKTNKCINEVFPCVCGGHYIKQNFNRHDASKKHRDWYYKLWKRPYVTCKEREERRTINLNLTQDDIARMFGLID